MQHAKEESYRNASLRQYYLDQVLRVSVNTPLSIGSPSKLHNILTHTIAVMKTIVKYFCKLNNITEIYVFVPTQKLTVKVLLDIINWWNHVK